ncbi:GMP synthase [glutamine-hydrolyzing] [Actinomyces bovis]|uniref:GMP synthase [glutamine-hydrolyzing] n=1 Tax=Actinomyces bovis TaxID=1658 RepID=A0ABY1VLE3_9ACTO|nr:gamma-glutamyl-gamma-aminobutyrate hydrolase family protein [Actinomyces bovis]SPT52487.1 GMP synthase [glutamine-hydrolyzing] [Actinomyces bovis]VEG54187.1 GMP synthase [glutamine-hydrolyzing] [Actinomyces israelii]
MQRQGVLIGIAPVPAVPPATASRPFLLAVCRYPGAIADDELAMIRASGPLRNDELEGLELLDPSATEPEELDLSSYAGVLITGSPLSLAGHAATTPDQERLTSRALRLCRRLVQEDIPTLGLCFGLQAIVLALGGSLRDDVGEELQAPSFTLTEAGRLDPLTGGLPERFRAYVGHSESASGLPGGGVLLVQGERCPIQMARWGQRVYGTQFHPEITTAGMRLRIEAYGDTYYAEQERAAVIERCDAAAVTEANSLVARFIQLCRQDSSTTWGAQDA